MKAINRKVFRRLGVTFASLLVFFSAGYTIAMSQKNAINNFLNVDTGGKGTVEGANYFPSDYSSTEELQKACDALPEEVMKEGAVLLKNENNALPLASGSKISLVGQGSAVPAYSASGSSATTSVEFPKPIDAFTEKGFSVNPTLDDFYRNGEGKNYGRNQGYDAEGGIIRLINECPYSSYTDDVKNSLAEYGDAAIYILSRDAGEGLDVNAGYADGVDGSYLSLSEEEISVFQGLAELKSQGKIKKIIVLLNSAVPVRSDYLFEDSYGIDAALWTGCFGSKGIYGAIDILTGEVNPSGRISDTLLKDNFSSPVMATWMNNSGMTYAQRYTNYKEQKLNSTQRYYGINLEGIYVGYRYYETRYADVVTKRNGAGDFTYSDEVSFPFGTGLSYTAFEYSDFKVTASEDGKTYDVSLKVTNTGSVKGKNAVEIYLQKPYTQYDIDNGVEKSAVELVGFSKTKELEPNESEDVTVSVSASSFTSYDSNNAKGYILDAGSYRLTVADNAHKATNNFLAADGYNTTSGMDENGDATLVATALEQEALDTETYKNSSATGKEITNQLDFMDMNKYENRGDNAVTYVSRSDWTSTFPTEAVSFSCNDAMKEDLASHKEITEEEGASMPSYSQDNGLTLADLREKDYSDSDWDKLVDQMSFEEQQKLCTSGAFSTEAISSVGKPATLDNDGPTGIIKTKTGLVMPGLGVWASSFNHELLAKIGDIMAEDVRNCGYHTLYAPGVNIHRSPFGGRLNEYYSEDPLLTGICAGEVISASQKKGVLMTVKHFAFNEEEAQRNGICVWMNEQEAREIMLKPFQIVLSSDGYKGHTYMTSFNRAGCIWAGACKNLLVNIVREEWGFDGYSVTDMASGNGALYMTYDDAYMNGADLFLGSETSLADYSSNPTFCQNLRTASKHILYTIGRYSCAMNGIASDTVISEEMPWWQVTLIVFIALFAVLTVASVTFWILSYFLKPKTAN